MHDCPFSARQNFLRCPPPPAEFPCPSGNYICCEKVSSLFGALFLYLLVSLYQVQYLYQVACSTQRHRKRGRRAACSVALDEHSSPLSLGAPCWPSSSLSPRKLRSPPQCTSNRAAGWSSRQEGRSSLVKTRRLPRPRPPRTQPRHFPRPPLCRLCRRLRLSHIPYLAVVVRARMRATRACATNTLRAASLAVMLLANSCAAMTWLAQATASAMHPLSFACYMPKQLSASTSLFSIWGFRTPTPSVDRPRRSPAIRTLRTTHGPATRRMDTIITDGDLQV